MFSIKKFFVPDPVDASELPGQGALAGVHEVAAPAEADWDHPDVRAAAKQAEAAAPETFVDWVDWNATGALALESLAEGLQKQGESRRFNTGYSYFNYRTGDWDDGGDPEGIYNPIGYD